MLIEEEMEGNLLNRLQSMMSVGPAGFPVKVT